MRYIILIFVIFIACTSNNNPEKEQSKNEKNVIVQDNENLSDFNFVYDMTSMNGETLGKVYIKSTNDTLFSGLKIIKDNKELYIIEKHKLMNVNGIDIEARQDNFFGWTFLMKEEDYFVLNLFHDNGKSIGDNVNVEWNYEMKIFEVHKTP